MPALIARPLRLINTFHHRIWLIVLIFIASIVVGNVLDMTLLKTSLLHERMIQTRYLVESGHAILTHFQALEAEGKLTRAEAQKSALDALRAVRFGGTEYFWINDLGQPFPRMIMHPTEPELEGKLLDSEKFNTTSQVAYGDSGKFIDLEGPKNLFMAMSDVVRQSTYGFVRYEWRKPLADGKISAGKFPKLSFVRGFGPWEWVIGSGIYIDDIDQEMAIQLRHYALRTAVLSLFIIAFAALIARGTRDNEETLKRSQRQMQALIDATSESVLLVDASGRIQAINEFGARRFQKRVADLLGMDFFTLLPPGLNSSRREACEQVIASGEAALLRDQRNGIHFENNIYPVLDDDGKTTGVAVYAKDVTEQHQTRATEEIFRHLDTVLLKWQMGSVAVAQIFCDNILPIFNLRGAWVGKALASGRVELVASASQGGAPFIHESGLPLDWRADGKSWPNVADTISNAQRILQPLLPENNTEHAIAARAAGIAAALALPLTLQGKTWGTLVLYSDEPHALAASQQRLSSICGRLAVSLESAQQQEWLSLLNSALTGVGQGVFITDAENHILWANPAFTRMTGYSLTEVQDRTPQFLHAETDDAQRYTTIRRTTRNGHSWDGEVEFLDKHGRIYPVHKVIAPLLDGEQNITHYVTIIEDITEQKSLAEQIRHMAHFDLLTDLPNRALFHDRLNQAMSAARRHMQVGALLFLDLDGFKAVNDQHGHATGDAVLVEVARRLRQVIRESDTVARLGGDEFTVILSTLSHPQDAVRVAENILNAISQPMMLSVGTISIGVSIGIAHFPRPHDRSEELLHAADTAMYRAKESGRNTICCASDPSLLV